MKIIPIALLLGASLAAGCATTESADQGEHASREYVTGSNIPKKSRGSGDAAGVSVYSREELERVRDATTSMPRPGVMPASP